MIGETPVMRDRASAGHYWAPAGRFAIAARFEFTRFHATITLASWGAGDFIAAMIRGSRSGRSPLCLPILPTRQFITRHRRSPRFVEIRCLMRDASPTAGVRRLRAYMLRPTAAGGI